MATTIPREPFLEWLSYALDETFEKVHGIYLDGGTSLFETLATISADEASRLVSTHCASLAAQVAHVRFYLDVQEHVILGTYQEDADWGEIWRTVEAVTPEEWEASKARLRASYERIRALIRGIETWEGEEEISGVLSSVVHTAYHLGEIRQALCTLKS